MKQRIVEEITVGIPDLAIVEAVDTLVCRLVNELKAHALVHRSTSVHQRSEAMSGLPEFQDGLRKELTELLRERVSEYFTKQQVYTTK